MAWEEGYEYAVSHSVDLKQLLELEELLIVAKQNESISSQNHVVELCGFPASESGSLICSKSSEICNNHDKLNGKLESHNESNETLEIHNKSSESNGKVKGFRKFEVQPIGTYDRKTNGNYDCPELGDELEVRSRQSSTICNKSIDKTVDKIETFNKSNVSFDIPKLGDGSKVCSGFNDISEPCNQSSAIFSKSIDKTESRSKSTYKADITELSDQAKRNKKLSVTRISKTKSINVDFRLSRGIAQVITPVLGKFSYDIWLLLYIHCCYIFSLL